MENLTPKAITNLSTPFLNNNLLVTLFIASRLFLSPLERRIGTSDMKSTPPATTTSLCPEAIWLTPVQHARDVCVRWFNPAAGPKLNYSTEQYWTTELKGYSEKYWTIYLHYFSPVVIAMLEEIQAMVTVWQGIRSLNPDSIAAWARLIRSQYW